MADIAKIDKNFQVMTRVERENIQYYDIEEEPFRIYGVKKENGKFRRMPEKIAESVNQGVLGLHTNTAGGRVRFVTDSNYVAIHAEMDGIPPFPHMPLSGCAGFDLYVKDAGIEKYQRSFIPPYGVTDGYESVIDFPDKQERLITINFPLYSNVNKLYIGLEGNASLKQAPPYTFETPVVYYGSSITQGGCASRPGNCYQNILTRRFDCDHINLGFSGSARGEVEMAEWIKQLSMQVFVLDYDYNAPDPEHLKATHERMFTIIRNANPRLPIIIMSRPQFYLTPEEQERLAIIRATYEHALAAGDKNVYFIDGPSLMELIQDNGTVDNCHPTDSGFASMAAAVGKVLEKILRGDTNRGIDNLKTF